MAQLVWDATGDRLYETGTDRGVLYVQTEGLYPVGVAWNGLVSVSESPTGGEPTAQYADNIKYLNLMSEEEFAFTLEAFTYPDEFMECDGTASPSVGVYVGQQTRKPFGFSYRTLVGNDEEATDHGYKLHLVYGALASPSDKAYSTVNDTPEAITFSWEVTTTPVPVTEHKPTAHIVIDSTKVDAADLTAIEEILYGGGSGSGDASLPMPDVVLSMFEE